MQTINEFFQTLDIDAFVAIAFVASFFMSMLTAKQGTLLQRSCNAVACGVFASSIVPVLQYFNMNENLNVFFAVVIGYMGCDQVMEMLKDKLGALLNKIFNKS